MIETQDFKERLGSSDTQVDHSPMLVLAHRPYPRHTSRTVASCRSGHDARAGHALRNTLKRAAVAAERARAEEEIPMVPLYQGFDTKDVGDEMMHVYNPRSKSLLRTNVVSEHVQECDIPYALT